MPTTVLDIEQHLLLLELTAPFDKRDVQLARRRMAKRWHPDVAPQGRQFEHERHLKAINEAADQLERLAEGSRGGNVSRDAVRASAAAARSARAEAGKRAYEAEQRARAHASEKAKHDPFASRVPDHSVVHRYARCLSYPEWGVGTVAGIYFSGNPDDDGPDGAAARARGSQDGAADGDGAGALQWARVRFSHGVRTVPAGSMRFVDFSKPDPAEERVERFMIAAQRAMAEGDYRAGRPAAGVRTRCRTQERDGAAADDARVLAGGESRRGCPLGARLGPSGRQPAGSAPDRGAHLRRHRRDGPGGGGGRARCRCAGPPTREHGSGWAACACACATARVRSRRSSARSRWAPPRRSATCWPRLWRSNRAWRPRRRRPARTPPTGC